VKGIGKKHDEHTKGEGEKKLEIAPSATPSGLGINF
jgi:hypothetical protein